MTKPKKQSSPAVSNLQTAERPPRRQEIEVRAFQIYVDRGGAHGQDVDDWLQAEHELLEKYAKTAAMTKAAVV